MAQVVAEEFGIDLDQVRITADHDRKVPNTSATAASSGTDLNGMAARAAAAAIKGRLIDFAAETYEVPADQHRVPATTEVLIGNRAIAFPELVKQAYLARISLSSTGFYRTPKIHWEPSAQPGGRSIYFAYGAACSEVVVDTLTGEMKVERVDILHDVGRSLNPAIDIGQIEGGFVQGMGWLTTEELCWTTRAGCSPTRRRPTRSPARPMCRPISASRCSTAPIARRRSTAPRRSASRR